MRVRGALTSIVIIDSEGNMDRVKRDDRNIRTRELYPNKIELYTQVGEYTG